MKSKLLLVDCSKLFRKGKNHRVIGDFIAGVNAPTGYNPLVLIYKLNPGLQQLSKSYLKPEMTHQIELLVGENFQPKDGVTPGCAEVYFQFLIDCSGWISEYC